MFKSCARQSLLVASLLMAASPSFADSTEKVTKGESIAGKASKAKTTPAKAPGQRKRYEFAAAGTAAAGTAAQTTNLQAGQSVPAAMSEKSHCHSSKSDV